MITDLAQSDGDERRVNAQVLVIGAGIAGLVLGDQLRRKGIQVVVLESGGREQQQDVHVLNTVDQLGESYTGAERGRFRCLGGTSTRWGGALIPFSDHDLSPRPYIGVPGLAVRPAEVNSFLPRVEEMFALDNGSFEEEFVHAARAEREIPIGNADFKIRFAKWPPFGRRNLASLLRSRFESDPEFDIVLNATATSFQICENGRIASVTARSLNGRSLNVTADNIVVCAGAIESTRLLLLLSRQHSGRIFADCRALGRYFHDHVSRPMAQIDAQDVHALNRFAGFRFVGPCMRSLRFELSAQAQERERVGSAFGHISFRTAGPTGFDVVRDAFRAIQRTRRVPVGTLIAAVRQMPFIAQMGFWRAAYGQLLWPKPAIYELHAVVEQRPDRNNYITLSDRPDPLGMPCAAIHWRVSDTDRQAFSVFRKCFAEYWERSRLISLGRLNWLEQSVSAANHGGSDVYHPGGTTRMGDDRRSAVVNSDLQTFEVPNLWVASTSVLPAGGGANPTLTLIMLAMRLAEKLTSKPRQQDMAAPKVFANA
jgi:choline dehydrogenase-like flavoprotein